MGCDITSGTFRNSSPSDLELFIDNIIFLNENKDETFLKLFGSVKGFRNWVEERTDPYRKAINERDSYNNLFARRSLAILQHDFFTKNRNGKLHRCSDREPVSWFDIAEEITHAANKQRAKRALADQISQNFVINFDKSMKKESQILLSGEELSACDDIGKWLAGKTSGRAAFLRCKPFDGAEILPLALGHSLRGTEETAFSKAYDRVIYLGPRPREGGTEIDYDFPLRQVKGLLGVTEWSDFEKVMVAERVLVVIASANIFTDSPNSDRHSFLKSIKRMDNERTRVLFLVDPDGRELTAGVKNLIDGPVSSIPKKTALDAPALYVPAVDFSAFRDRERFEGKPVWLPTWRLYQDHVKRYATIHKKAGTDIRDPSDYRDFVAQWSYSHGAQPPADELPETLRPCDLRMRAFLSAQRASYALDCTMGFMALSALPETEWPIEIRAHVNVIRCWLAEMERPKNKLGKTSIQILRFISMAQFWMSEPSLEKLCTLEVKEKNEADFFNPTTLINRRNTLEALLKSGIVRADGKLQASGGDIRYFLPLGVRALIADDWIARASETRSIAHLAYAELLYSAESDNVELRNELPFPALDRDRTRIYLLAEVIRHMCRSAECTKLKRGPRLGTDRIVSGNVGENWPHEFLSSKRPDLGGKKHAPGHFAFSRLPPGVDRNELVGLAYGQVFQNLMGEVRGAANAITNRYGMFRVEAECIHLLKQAGLMTHPKAQFQEVAELRIREAKASFELGALDLAIRQLEQIEKNYNTAEFKDQGRAIRIRVRIALADIYREQRNINEMRKKVVAARQCLDKLRDKRLRKAAGVKRVGLLKLEERLAGREALLDIEDGRRLDALDRINRACENLHGSFLPPQDRRDLQFIRRRRAQAPTGVTALAWIEALLSAPIAITSNKFKQSIRDARIACHSNRSLTSPRANTHLGLLFAIQRAELLRLEGDIGGAETALDEIKDYIESFGCGSKTLIMFELIAGRVLLSKEGKQIERALGMYLMPCFRRAVRLGFHHVAGLVYQSILPAWEQVKAEHPEYTSGSAPEACKIARLLETEQSRLVVSPEVFSKEREMEEETLRISSIPQILYWRPQRLHGVASLTDVDEVIQFEAELSAFALLEGCDFCSAH